MDILATRYLPSVASTPSDISSPRDTRRYAEGHSSASRYILGGS